MFTWKLAKRGERKKAAMHSYVTCCTSCDTLRATFFLFDVHSGSLQLFRLYDVWGGGGGGGVITACWPLGQDRYICNRAGVRIQFHYAAVDRRSDGGDSSRRRLPRGPVARLAHWRWSVVGRRHLASITARRFLNARRRERMACAREIRERDPTHSLPDVSTPAAKCSRICNSSRC